MSQFALVVPSVTAFAFSEIVILNTYFDLLGSFWKRFRKGFIHKLRRPVSLVGASI